MHVSVRKGAGFGTWMSLWSLNRGSAEVLDTAAFMSLATREEPKLLSDDILQSRRSIIILDLIALAEPQKYVANCLVGQIIRDFGLSFYLLVGV